LLSVLMIGVIAMATMSSILLISIGILRSGFAFQQSVQSIALAHTCAESALRSLWEQSDYTGNESVALPEGECDILRVGGAGNENRSVCVEGRAGDTVRRFEIILQRILPSIQITSWTEVEHFTACSYQ
ncbi:MAG: hypothetical protein PHS73_01540, partial [Candidatus Peribacteraceae bacterium]|nr:hypothetical protein [Candidatus Peribacteraceae bacterium]